MKKSAGGEVFIGEEKEQRLRRDVAFDNCKVSPNSALARIEQITARDKEERLAQII